MPALKKRLERESTVGHLPALEEILHGLRRFTSDPKTTVFQISEQVSRDPSLAVRLLRMANSAYYTRAEPVVSLEEAVLFLGVEQVRTVSVTMGCVERMSPQDKSGFKWPDFWRHCIATAYVARILGRFFHRKHADPELDYIAGLLHDVGKLVIAMLFPDGFGYVFNKAREQKLSFCEAEQNYFDTDHAALGGWYLERQNMPPAVFETVRCHHNWTLSVENQEIAAIVNVANHFAHENALGCSGNMQERVGSFTEIPSWRFLLDTMTLKEDASIIEQRLREESQRLGGLVEVILPGTTAPLTVTPPSQESTLPAAAIPHAPGSSSQLALPG